MCTYAGFPRGRGGGVIHIEVSGFYVVDEPVKHWVYDSAYLVFFVRPQLGVLQHGIKKKNSLSFPPTRQICGG